MQAVNAVRIEAQMNLAKAVMEERAQKEIAVQQALAQSRQEMQEKMDSVTVVSNDKTAYRVEWVTQPSHGQSNIGNIMDGEGEESDKEKE